jgi:LmbE family N-acetylglucosaminyl deacetylase
MQLKKIFLIIGFWICVSSDLYSQELSPLLPDTGQLAIVQKKIDLRGGLAVLSIAIAPGFEDIPALAYFRLKKGAGIGCVYITNGEDFPNFESGKNAYETAQQRKEEAYQAMSLLQGEAFFLNAPASDYLSAENDTTEIDKYYSRLDEIISAMKPDVILVNSDHIFSNGISRRLQAIEKNVEATLSRLKKSNQWSDVTLFVHSNENNRGDRLQVDELNVPRKKSYRNIAEDVTMQYRSLRAMFPVWKSTYQPRYIAVYPKRVNQLKISEAHSPNIPPRLKELALSVNRIAESREGQSSQNQLNSVHEAIAKIDFFINHIQKTLSPQEKKLLLFWKSTLEEYRCVLRNVFVPYTLQDKKVVASQLFFVKIDFLGSWIKNGRNHLLFPGVIDQKWIVDTRQDYSYPLLADTTWRIISPDVFPVTSPVNEGGYNAVQMRNKFTFMVVHEEEHVSNNFVYQKDIPLIGVPSHSLEILTPYLFANRDTTAVVKITNNLFNAMKGEILGEDSLVSLVPYRISLLPKSTVTDSMMLHWKGTCFYGEHEVILKNQNNSPIGKLICKGIDIHTTGKQPIGVFSMINNTPLSLAMHRIGYPTVDLTNADIHEFKNISTVLLDEESSKNLNSHPDITRILKEWISAGGKMIVLPQYGPHPNQIPDDSVVFNYHDPILSATEINVDTAQFLFHYPNVVEVKNWQTAGSVITYGDIHVKMNMPIAIPLTSQRTKMPLMVVRRYGRGSIIYSAFNLHPQLLTIQTEAYKFLANILSN